MTPCSGICNVCVRDCAKHPASQPAEGPKELDEHEHAVWVFDGDVAIDTNLPASLGGLSLGYRITTERARELATQLLACAAAVDARKAAADV